jgi:tetratricopeptide (TPR) repeat protein
VLLEKIFTIHDPNRRFALFDQAINEFKTLEKKETLLIILEDYLNKYPDDPYKAYYYSLFANYYFEEKAFPMAITYYRKILYNTQDLILSGQSIHLLILKKWLSINNSLEDRIIIYELLISSFPDQIDLGECYYYLAKSYEKNGDFDKSLSYYKRFLKEPESNIPGVIEAREEVQAIIHFQNSNKSWTFETLDDLVNAVKYAIGRKRFNLLNDYQSDNFFILSWSQKMMSLEEDVNIGDLDKYSYNHIYYSPALESFSNENEAYLKTWGWSYRVKPWYLYFRQINFPSDPEINGRWEWVGIYMGQPL